MVFLMRLNGTARLIDAAAGGTEPHSLISMEKHATPLPLRDAAGIHSAAARSLGAGI